MIFQRCSVRWLAATLGVRLNLLRGVDARVASFYKSFLIARPGKTARRIDRPVGALKVIQTRIKDAVLADFAFPDPLHGCVRGRSPLSNAAAHGKTVLLVRLDLEGFYPSVTCAMVYAVWRDVFGFGPPIAAMLTRLTTHCGHLPQGAPTSGYLANIVLLPAAARIKEICAALGCEVTFFVDDISISGDRARDAIEPVIELLRKHGLTVGRGKTAVMTPQSPQITTGYGINSGRPSVPQYRRDRAREVIHQLGVQRTLGHDYSRLLLSIKGTIAHIERTNPGNAARLRRLLAREITRPVAHR